MASEFHLIQYEEKPPNKLSDLLSEEQKQALGPIEQDWFEQHAGITSTAIPGERKSDDIQGIGTITHPASLLSPPVAKDNAAVTSPPLLDKDNAAFLSPAQHLEALPSPQFSPSPFSPNVPRDRKDRRKGRPLEDSGLLSPTTPGNGADTPLHLHDVTPGFTSPIVDPKSLMKCLFKTPGSVVSKTPGSRLVQSLGVDAGNVSWTSSMATPGGEHLAALSTVKKDQVSVQSENTGPVGAARALFTPDNKPEAMCSQEEFARKLDITMEQEEEEVKICIGENHVGKSPSPDARCENAHVSSDEPVQDVGKLSSGKNKQKASQESIETSHNNAKVCSKVTDMKVEIEVRSPYVSPVGKRKSNRRSARFTSSPSLDDALSIFNTPPSTSTIRRTIKRQKRKISSDPLDVSPMFLSPIACAKPNLPFDCDTECDRKDMESAKNSSVKKRRQCSSPTGDLFTQISPSALSAMCNSANGSSLTSKRWRKGSDESNVDGINNSDKNQEEKLMSSPSYSTVNEVAVDTNEENVNNLDKKSLEQNIVEVSSSPKILPKFDPDSECLVQHVKDGEEERDEMFSQLSQRAVDAMLDVSDQASVGSAADLDTISDVVLNSPSFSRTEAKQQTPVRWKSNSSKKVLTPNASLHSKRPLSLTSKRKKGFFYPTTNQIAETCPKKVFNMPGIVQHLEKDPLMIPNEQPNTETLLPSIPEANIHQSPLDRKSDALKPIQPYARSSNFTSLTDYSKAMKDQENPHSVQQINLHSMPPPGPSSATGNRRTPHAKQTSLHTENNATNVSDSERTAETSKLKFAPQNAATVSDGERTSEKSKPKFAPQNAATVSDGERTSEKSKPKFAPQNAATVSDGERTSEKSKPKFAPQNAATVSDGERTSEKSKPKFAPQNAATVSDGERASEKLKPKFAPQNAATVSDGERASEKLKPKFAPQNAATVSDGERASEKLKPKFAPQNAATVSDGESTSEKSKPKFAPQNAVKVSDVEGTSEKSKPKFAPPNMSSAKSVRKTNEIEDDVVTDSQMLQVDDTPWFPAPKLLLQCSAGTSRTGGHIGVKKDNVDYVHSSSTLGKSKTTGDTTEGSASRVFGDHKAIEGEVVEVVFNQVKLNDGEKKYTQVDPDIHFAIQSKPPGDSKKMKVEKVINRSMPKEKLLPVTSSSVNNGSFNPELLNRNIQGPLESSVSLSSRSSLMPNTSQAQFGGFKAASGKSLVLSKEALERAAKLCEAVAAEFEVDNDLQKNMQDQSKSHDELREVLPVSIKASSTSKDMATVPKFVGFQSASCKSVNLSEEALKKAEAFVVEESDTEESIFALQMSKPDVKVKPVSPKPKSNQDTKMKPTSPKPTNETFQLPRIVDTVDKSSAGENSVFTEDSIKAEALRRTRYQMQKSTSSSSSGGLNDSLDDFTCTQLTEITESNAALMDTDDDFACTLLPAIPEEPSLSQSSLPGNAPNKSRNHGERESLGISTTAQLEAESILDVMAHEKMESEHLHDDVLAEDITVFKEAAKGKKHLSLENPNPTVIGFKTGNGKDLPISEEAIKKAKLLFDEDLPEENLWSKDHLNQRKAENETNYEPNGSAANILKPQTDIQQSYLKHDYIEQKRSDKVNIAFAGFQTGSGKVVKVSEESLKKARGFLEDISTGKELQELQSENDEMMDQKIVQVCENPQRLMSVGISETCQEDKNAAGFVGFKTGAGKAVAISEDSIQKVKGLFDECYDKKSTNKSGFVGFQTGSGKTAKVSDKTLHDAKEMFQPSDFERTIEFSESTRQEVEDLKTGLPEFCALEKAGFAGFQTANGREVKVNEESLKKARNLLDESHERNAGSLKAVNDKKAIQATHGPTHHSLQENDSLKSTDCVGFQTAKGEAVTITGEGLKEAGGLYDEEHENSAAKMSFVGFQTGSGRTVHVSEKALKEAKDMLDDHSSDHATTAFGGLKTVRGKAVAVPEESLKEAAGILGDPYVTGSSKFIGFQTCSGKGVNISEKALKEAKDLLSDSSSEHNAFKMTGFAGFQTGSGKTVNISEESLKKARGLLEESHEKSAAKEVFVGFQTGSGKCVNVYEKALKEVKSLGDSSSEHDAFKPTGFAGFQTGRGNQVTVAEESLKKARGILDESHENNPAKELFIGFQTCSGKSVNVSEKALKEAKSLLSDSSSEHDAFKPTGFAGFQTGRGNQVTVTEESLKKARGILDESHENNPVKELFIGFQTCSGKSVNVSEKALKEAKSLLSDSSNEQDAFKPTGFTGFQTGSGKAASVSEESLKKARGILDESHENNPAKELFIGFQTCSGKSVNFSEKALKEAKSLLSDSSNGQDAYYTTGFAGFQAERGNTVSVSEEALKKARGILDDSHENSAAKELLVGFQTGSGKTVNISAKALHEAKGLLDESSGEHDTTKAFGGFHTGKAVVVSEESLKDAKGLHDEPNVTCPPKFGGFQTCSGKSVSVSEKALQEAKGLLGDCSAESSTVFEGFQTGRGKVVTVSEESLRKAQGLLDASHDSNTAKEKIGSGFQTCSGKTVGISEKALHEVKGLFDEFSREEQIAAEKSHNIHDVPLKESGSIGFHSGSGKAVTVSKKALEEAKVLLQDNSFEQESSNQHLQSASSPHSPHSLRKSVTPSQEAEEIAGALLAAEDFDNDPWDFDAISSSKERAFVNDHEAGHFISDPDAMLHDRQCRGMVLPAAISVPPGDMANIQTKEREAHRGLGKISASHKCNYAYDRPHHLQTVPKAPSHLSPRKDKSHLQNKIARKTPQKESRPSAIKTTSKTPVKNQQTPSKGFSTPYKQPPSSFRTPVKTACQQKPQGQKETVPSVKESEEKEENANSLPEDNQDLRKNSLKAKVAQAQRIRKKKEAGDTKPQAGRLFTLRHKTPEVKRYTVHQAMRGGHPGTFTVQQLHSFGVLPSVLRVSASTAESFRFRSVNHYSAVHSASVRAGDGAMVVLDDDGTMGKEEICNAFFDMAGVEPKLISREWVYNHYKWIVWKLAAYEVSFPIQFAGRSLTPDQVMLQLKYRYDREVDNSQRSCLKKIYERDDTPQKAMVLCMAAIEGQNAAATNKQTDFATVLLTDGWYSIKAAVDRPLTALLRRGRLKVGDKVMVTGAELVGGQDGCSPLEAPPDTLLKLGANAVRRVRWHTRLGFYRNPQAAPLPLCSLYADGGHVGCVDVIITRQYPVQYLEKLPGGGSVFRGSRAEDRAARQYERERQRQTEQLFAKLQAQQETLQRQQGGSSSRGSRRWTSEQVSELYGRAEIYEAYQASADPQHFQSLLSVSQQESLSAHLQVVQERTHADMHAQITAQLAEMQVGSRSVVPLMKFRVAGCHNKDIDRGVASTLSIWRPAADIETLLKEGSRLRIYNLAVAEARGGVRTCDVCLTASRSTRYDPRSVDDNFLDIIYEPREVSSVYEISHHGYQPRYGEVDTAGVVIHVSLLSEFSKAGGDAGNVQTIQLADASQNTVIIKFWGGLQSHALDDLLTPGVFVACSNLQWQHGDRRGGSPVLLAGDLAVFSTKPRHAHLRQALDGLRAEIKNVKEFRDQVEGKVDQPTAESRNSGLRKPQTPVSGNSGQRHPPVAVNMQSVVPRQPLRCTTTTNSGEPKTPIGVQRNSPIPWQPKSKQQTLTNAANDAVPSEVVKSENAEENGRRIESDTVVNQRENVKSESSKLLESESKGGDCDPLLQKKKALQEAKAARLENYLGQCASPVVSGAGMLNSPVPLTVRRGFKAPSRSATPVSGGSVARGVGVGRRRGGGRRSSVGEELSRRGGTLTVGEELPRKGGTLTVGEELPRMGGTLTVGEELPQRAGISTDGEDLSMDISKHSKQENINEHGENVKEESKVFENIVNSDIYKEEITEITGNVEESISDKDTDENCSKLKLTSENNAADLECKNSEPQISGQHSIVDGSEPACENSEQILDTESYSCVTEDGEDDCKVIEDAQGCSQDTQGSVSTRKRKRKSSGDRAAAGGNSSKRRSLRLTRK